MKKIITLITLCLVCICFCMPIYALSLAGQPYLADNADIIASGDEGSLTKELQEASAKYNTDIIAVTVNGTDGKSIEAFADDYLDNYLDGNYGKGTDKSGVLMLIDMDSRAYWFSTRGEVANSSFTDYGIEAMKEDVSEFLSNGDYAGAISEYCKVAGGMIDYKNNNGYAYGDSPEGNSTDDVRSKNYGLKGIIGVVVGLLGSFGITNGMKSQLKTVERKTTATGYFNPANLRLKAEKDTFLYVNVSRIPIRTEPPKNGGGGLSTHTSSGGYTHGGGGGHF